MKLLEILCALYKSPRIAFLLYFLGTGDDQWLGILDYFTATDVLMILLLIMISVSKNLLGLPLLSTLYSNDRYSVFQKSHIILDRPAKSFKFNGSMFLYIVMKNMYLNDVDSLFISFSLGKTIDFIVDEIYIRKKLEPFCEKSVVKELLNKLYRGCTFLADGRLIIQVDGCPMGGLISVVLSNIFCVKMEFDVVKPLKPKLYKSYVDDIYSKRIKNQPDRLFRKIEELSSEYKVDNRGKS